MKKLGFTLAEVLITLVIIGVIAAMTVPTLMSNTNSQEFRSALKKAVSGVNQALTLHYALTSETAADAGDASGLVSKVFKTRMSVLDDTTITGMPGGQGNCNADTTFATADGVIFCVDDTAFNTSGTGCDFENKEICGTGPNFYIDVNGKKAPNKLTENAKRPKDVYQASIYSQRVVPYGVAQQVMFDSQGND